jgi:hypothetical protein
MRSRSCWRTSLALSSVVHLGLVIGFPVQPSRVEAQQTGWPGENKISVWNAPTRFLVVQAVAQGRPTIPLIVAANRGETERVEQLITSRHGTILKVIPEIGYIHAIFPTSQVFWLQQQAQVTDLEVVGDLKFGRNLQTGFPSRMKETIAAALQQENLEKEKDRKFQELQNRVGKLWGKVDLSLPLLPPDLLRDPRINANTYLLQPEWLKAHPTWDGRGITILSLEGAPDLDNPALQEAKDLQGNSIRKVPGVVDVVDRTPRTVAGDSDDDDALYSGEVRFGKAAKLHDGTVCPRPKAPADKVGVWKAFHYEQRLEYCVDWSTKDHVARIDINRNGSFDDDAPLRDFNKSYDFVKLPYSINFDDGQPEHHFTAYLLYDSSTETVRILQTGGDHTAMTSTAAAGTGYMNTSIGGMAPASRVMFFSFTHLSEVIEGLWSATSRPDVDLVTNSATIGGDSFANSGRTVTLMLLDRIMEVQGKPILTAVGNYGTPFEQGYDHSRLIIGVGGYIRDAQLQLYRFNNRTLETPISDYVFEDSASGPSPDGSFSTDILAPEVGIAGADCGSDHYTGSAYEGQVGLAYRMPPCYSISGGTSTAAPRAAGAVALLLSAAKQEGLRPTVAQIKTALAVSARYLPEQPAFRQGPGLLQLPDAWAALEEAARKPPVSIVASTPDLSPLYPQFWDGPLVGKSIYVTRGFHPGEKKSLKLDLDLSGLEATDLSFTLLGNDGTFNITAREANGRSKMTLLLSAEATAIGNKSAILEVRAKGWTYPVARFPILVVATPSPDKLRTGVSLSGTYSLASSDFFLFEPPKDAAAIEVDGTATGDPMNIEFVMTTNPTLTFNSGHGLQYADPIFNGQRKYILPLQHSDIVGMKITNSRVGDTPDQPTQFHFTVRALTQAELLSSGNHKSGVLAVEAESQVPARTVLGTPIRERDVSVPLKGVDAMVISFPNARSEPGHSQLAAVHLYMPPDERGKKRLWNYYSNVSRDTIIPIPRPISGTWKVMLTGSDPGPIKVELLRKSDRKESGPERSYFAFGSLCDGATCANTWPLDDPFWRSMPLFPLPAHAQTKSK